MSDQIDTRTPEEIERDIERTRADFSSTVEALQKKLQPRELADQAVEYVMATPPVASTMNVVNSVRANPIPLAMIGVGVAWLMASNRRMQQNAHYPQHQRVVRRVVYHSNPDMGYESGYRSAQHESGSEAGLLRRASTAVGETGRGLRDKASAAGERISGTASGVATRLSGTASDVANRASEVGQQITGTASEMTDRAKRATQTATARLQETAQQAQARASQIGQRSQEEFYRAKDQFSHLLDEQPLVVGALGIAMGAALGAALPATRRENELLGPKRDELMTHAREATREHAETVKQSAQRLTEMAKEEIGHVIEVAKEDAGAIADAAKQEVHQARDKMSR